MSNARWPQQIQSVNRILTELKLSEIPIILALNKSDLLDSDALDAALRQARSEAGEVVTMSAIQPDSLAPLLDKAGAVLARNLAAQSSEDERYKAAVSRIA